MFFSVNKPIKIAGAPYIPCVCYESNRFLEPTIQKLAQEGTVVLYTKRVVFCNGKIIDNKKVTAKPSKVQAEVKKEEKKEVFKKEETFVKGF